MGLHMPSALAPTQPANGRDARDGAAALAPSLRIPRAARRRAPIATPIVTSIVTPIFVAIIAIAALALTGCRKKVEPPAGDILADLALPMSDGNVFDPRPLYDRDVLVMFYSPTCGHCMREMPEAVDAAEKSGSAILAVMVGGDLAQAQSLAVAHRLSAPVLLDDGQLRRKYDIRSVPYTLVVAAGGRAERAFIGAQGGDRLLEAMRDLRD